jgi:hypothetical protein
MTRTTFDLQRLHDYISRFHSEVFVPALPPVSLVKIGEGADDRLKYYIARFLHRLFSDVRIREMDITKQFLRAADEFVPSLDFVTGMAHGIDEHGNVVVGNTDKPLSIPVSLSNPSSFTGFMKSFFTSKPVQKDHDPFFDALVRMAESRNKTMERVRASVIDVAGKLKQLSIAKKDVGRSLVWGVPELVSGVSGSGNGLVEGKKWFNVDEEWVPGCEETLRAFAMDVNGASLRLAEQSDLFAGDVMDSVMSLINENKCLGRLYESRSEAMTAYSIACSNTSKRLSNLQAVKAQSKISKDQVDRAIGDLGVAEKEEEAWRERTRGVGARVKLEVDRAIPIWKMDLDEVFVKRFVEIIAGLIDERVERRVNLPKDLKSIESWLVPSL